MGEGQRVSNQAAFNTCSKALYNTPQPSTSLQEKSQSNWSRAWHKLTLRCYRDQKIWPQSPGTLGLLNTHSPKHTCLLVMVTWDTSLPISHLLHLHVPLHGCPYSGQLQGQELRPHTRFHQQGHQWGEQNTAWFVHQHESHHPPCAAFSWASLQAGLPGARSLLD